MHHNNHIKEMHKAVHWFRSKMLQHIRTMDQMRLLVDQVKQIEQDPHRGPEKAAEWLRDSLTGMVESAFPSVSPEIPMHCPLGHQRADILMGADAHFFCWECTRLQREAARTALPQPSTSMSSIEGM